MIEVVSRSSALNKIKEFSHVYILWSDPMCVSCGIMEERLQGALRREQGPWRVFKVEKNKDTSLHPFDPAQFPASFLFKGGVRSRVIPGLGTQGDIEICLRELT
jgi:hypothetical protein